MGGVTIIDARADWLTASARNGEHADLLEQYMLDWLTVEESAGERIRAKGFEGYSGLGTDHLFVGRRQDGVLVRLGGSTAADALPDLVPIVDHVSRIDYCVTAQLEDTERRPAHELWELGQVDDRDCPGLPSIVRTEKRWGGYTTYVGDRVSAIHARVYDKFAESKGRYPPGSWRWELELKRFASEQEHQALQADLTRSQCAIDLVGGQFARWGIETPWSRATDRELWKAPPRKRDVDKTLEWFRTQVGPAVDRALKAGRRTDVIRALGLDHEVAIKER